MKYEGKGELDFLKMISEVYLAAVDFNLEWAVMILVN